MSNCKKKNYNQFKYIIQKGVIDKLHCIIAGNTDFKKPQTIFFKYLYVIDKVTRHYIDNHHDFSITNYDGCHISIMTLKKILGTDNGQTIRIIQDLIEHKIIKRVGNYLKNSHSYKYILADLTFKSFEYFTCNPRHERISYNIISRHNEVHELNNSDLILYESYLKKIKVNDIESIDNQYNLKVYPMLADFKIDGVSWGRTESVNDLLLDSLIRIENGDYDIHRKDERSRVYTAITNLKRELRALLRYEGQGFIEFDIRNSQPLIASILIKNHWVQKNRDIPTDVLNYVKDCENGTFYDYFMEKNNILREQRSEFKVMFFADLFFSKVKKTLSPLTRQFIEKYPSCYEAICAIKGGIGSGSYNEFSISLQRTEAQIIFDDVNLGLIKKGIPAFNIFDSILCLPQNKEIVKEAILTAFRKYNLNPTINTKDYTEVITISEALELVSINKSINESKSSKQCKTGKFRSNKRMAKRLASHRRIKRQIKAVNALE